MKFCDHVTLPSMDHSKYRIHKLKLGPPEDDMGCDLDDHFIKIWQSESGTGPRQSRTNGHLPDGPLATPSKEAVRPQEHSPDDGAASSV